MMTPSGSPLVIMRHHLHEHASSCHCKSESEIISCMHTKMYTYVLIDDHTSHMAPCLLMPCSWRLATHDCMCTLAHNTHHVTRHYRQTARHTHPFHDVNLPRLATRLSLNTKTCTHANNVLMLLEQWTYSTI